MLASQRAHYEHIISFLKEYKNPRDAQRVCSQKSNWCESVLHGSHVCLEAAEPFLTPRPMTLSMTLFMTLS